MEVLFLIMCFSASLSPRVTSTPVINDRLLTWWRAAKECEQDGTKLFVLETEDDVNLLSNTLNDEDNHWIGGLTFLSWKWSCDNASFYKPVCQSAIHCDTKQTITGNSAYKCHQSCTPSFGLQGETCCCLGHHSYKCTNTTQPQIRCKGNLDDFCGSENLMSVYDMDIGDSVIEPSHRCIYTKKDEDRVWWQGDNCLNKRSMAGHKENGPGQFCEGGVEVTKELKDWDTWSAENKLLKVTNNNIDDLSNKMRNFGGDISTYWIGLRGYLDSRWLFATNMDIPKPEDEGSIDEYCLAVRKSNVSIEYNWNTCEYPLKAVCRKVHSTTTFATATTTNRSEETSSHTTTSIELTTPLDPTSGSSQSSSAPSTVVSSATQDVTSTVASSPATSELSTHTGIEQETASSQGGYTALYVGIPIGIVLIIGVVVGCIFYRQRRVCFSKRKDDTTGKPEIVSAFESPTATAKTLYFSLDDNFTNTQDSMYENIQSVERNELQPFSTYSLANMAGSKSGSNGACYEDVGDLRDLSKENKVKATPKVNLVNVEGNKVEDTEGHKVKDTAGGFKVKHKTEQHMPNKRTVFNQNTEYELAFDSDISHENESEDTYNHIEKDIFQSQTPVAKAYDHVNTQGRRIVVIRRSANQSLNENEDTYDHTNVHQGKAAALDTNYSNIQLADEDSENAHCGNNYPYDHTTIRQGNADTSDRVLDLADANDETVYDHTNTHHANKVNRGRNYDHITVGNSDEGNYDVTGVASQPFYDETYSHVTDTDQIYSLATV